jgi:2-phosphosulfolactate phosphatase
MKEIIRRGPGKRFFEPGNQEWAPSNDFELCLQRNIFDFILKVENDGSINYLQKVKVTEKTNTITR